MRIFPALIALTIVVAAAGGVVAETLPPTTIQPDAQQQLLPGRFQLFQARYTFINCAGHAYPKDELMLLDTTTGKVYVAVSNQFPKDGKFLHSQGWAPFEQQMTFATCDVK